MLLLTRKSALRQRQRKNSLRDQDRNTRIAIIKRKARFVSALSCNDQ
jgi:hypothetical protein